MTLTEEYTIDSDDSDIQPSTNNSSAMNEYSVHDLEADDNPDPEDDPEPEFQEPDGNEFECPDPVQEQTVLSSEPTQAERLSFAQQHLALPATGSSLACSRSSVVPLCDPSSYCASAKDHAVIDTILSSVDFSLVPAEDLVVVD